ncbi:MAG: serine/threonine-protein kinase [Deltaproteobacteria bacterium]|jgi:serine/threonine protein kinase|nr:serine/threonine-protein kinase [Deltaproteobacteria bacterium]
MVGRPIEFGKYILLDRVAIGGMAEIFRAKISGAAQFEKVMVIKRIHPNMSDDKEFISMFIDEAKIVGQLNQQNIAQIFELGRIEGHHFIAMEYIWGKDLLQILTKFKKAKAFMNAYQAAFITKNICGALDYAHKKKNSEGELMNIIHRDVSPQNILVSYNGEVKIIDFGIAKARNRSSHTAAGVLKGKFGYMSPEQVRGLPLDHRSDIFAIGTLLYEMLTSRPLFVGKSDLDVLEKVRNVEVPPPKKINPRIPDKLVEIIEKALTKDVEERYQWASDMQDELEMFLHSTDPVYSSKRLSMWMKKVFSEELKNEQDSLEKMLKLARSMEGLEEEEEEEKTVLVDEDDDLLQDIEVNISDEKTAFLGDDDEDEDAEYNEEATRILEDDEDLPGIRPEISEQKTQFLDEDDDATIRPNIAEQKTQFLDEDEGNPLNEAKTVLFDEDDPSMKLPSKPPISRPPHSVPPGSPSHPPFPPEPNIGIPGLKQPSQPSAPSMSRELKAKDKNQIDTRKQYGIMGGIGAGALIIGLILGKVIFGGGIAVPDNSSLIIFPQLESPALIKVDGLLKQKRVTAGEYIKLDKVPPGQYKVLLEGGKYKEMSKEVDIQEGKINISVLRPDKK